MISENLASTICSGEGDHKGFLTLNQHLTGFGRSPLQIHQPEVSRGR
jgi:hypothetical protein